MAKKATTTKTTTKRIKTARRDELTKQLAEMQMLGEIITWNAKADKDHMYSDVVNALKAAQLDPDVAKEFLPRHAFSRACRVLSSERVIDIFKEEGSELVFQFTDRIFKESGWDYSKKTFLRLNRETGIIKCEVDELREMAQKELDRCMVTRTTSDITRIVQKLFDDHADLYPVRDQGGVYFVPDEHRVFTSQVELFLDKLGGNIRRFAIPAGSQHSERDVQDAMADTFAKLLRDHQQAVKEFTIHTQKGTIESAADKIRATRVKIEAYAHYLKDKSEGLLKEVDLANEHLRAQVAALAGERAAAPPVDKESRVVYGHAMTAVVRWMGNNNWSFSEAKAVLSEMKVNIGEGTIRTQLRRGLKGEAGADLDEKQVKQLNNLRKKVQKGN